MRLQLDGNDGADHLDQLTEFSHHLRVERHGAMHDLAGLPQLLRRLFLDSKPRRQVSLDALPLHLTAGIVRSGRLKHRA